MIKFPYDIQVDDIIIANFVNESDAEIAIDALQKAFPDAILSINENLLPSPDLRTGH